MYFKNRDDFFYTGKYIEYLEDCLSSTLEDIYTRYPRGMRPQLVKALNHPHYLEKAIDKCLSCGKIGTYGSTCENCFLA